MFSHPDTQNLLLPGPKGSFIVLVTFVDIGIIQMMMATALVFLPVRFQRHTGSQGSNMVWNSDDQVKDIVKTPRRQIHQECGRLQTFHQPGPKMWL